MKTNMNISQLYIVQPDCLHVKKKNPFKKTFTGGAFNDGESKEYHDFERNNPQLPLTAWHQPGSEVKGRMVYQLYDHDWEQWQHGNYAGEVSWENFNKMWRTTRQAFEVISNVGGELDKLWDKAEQLHDIIEPMEYNPDEAKPELSVGEALIVSAKYGYEYHAKTQFPDDSFEDNCKNNFLQFISNHAIQSKELVKISDVEQKHIEIYKWLLGYYDFPEPPKDGRPRYYWRTHLREKLKEIGIEIPNPSTDNFPKPSQP